MLAAVNAIIEPLPALDSAEKYIPNITEVKPIICVQIKQERKLLPMSCAVAAGVTNKAVTSRVPTT